MCVTGRGVRRPEGEWIDVCMLPELDDAPSRVALAKTLYDVGICFAKESEEEEESGF